MTQDSCSSDDTNKNVLVNTLVAFREYFKD